jgi:hypothetical protein
MPSNLAWARGLMWYTGELQPGRQPLRPPAIFVPGPLPLAVPSHRRACGEAPGQVQAGYPDEGRDKEGGVELPETCGRHRMCVFVTYTHAL